MSPSIRSVFNLFLLSHNTFSILTLTPQVDHLWSRLTGFHFLSGSGQSGLEGTVKCNVGALRKCVYALTEDRRDEEGGPLAAPPPDLSRGKRCSMIDGSGSGLPIAQGD